MITPEESREVGGFLKGKNLPLDLKVEILDHISEQINYKVEIESKDFSLAFSEIKESWKEDLTMKKRFFFSKRITKIQRETNWKTNSEILKKTTIYFLIYFIVSLILIFYNKKIASNLIFGFYCCLTFIYFIVTVFNFKLLNSTSLIDNRQISYLQPNTVVFNVAGSLTALSTVFSFNGNFDRFYNSIQNLFYSGQFNQISFGSIMIFIVYAFGWIYGFLYFLEYKKSLKMLEQKINFKL